MPTASRCRRKIPRFLIPQGIDACVTFDYPEPGGRPCRMAVKDVSPVGISFVLGHELPGIEAGMTLHEVRVSLMGRDVRGDLVVMHVTPDANPGATCGALFYPARDEDAGALDALIREMGELS